MKKGKIFNALTSVEIQENVKSGGKFFFQIYEGILYQEQVKVPLVKHFAGN